MIKQKNNNIPQNRTKLWKAAAFVSIVLFLITLSILLNMFMIKEDRGKKMIKKIVLRQTEQIEQKEKVTTEAEKPNQKCENCQRRNIDGIYVSAEDSNPPLTAVMIDNHFRARPPHGIDKAKLVYEAEAEGNFTRYMAIFDTSEKIKKIGPVRSARPYFLDWARELGATYTHCGGSPEALVQILKEGIDNMNEFYDGEYFWRTNAKKAPHNILTSSENINKFIKKEKLVKKEFIPWNFKEDQVPTTTKHWEVKIDFNHADFKVSWKYNKKENDYTRYLTDKKHLTAGNNEITAKNIAIQRVESEVIDDYLRLKIKTIGEGDAIVCQDGECKEATWKKAGKGARTRFYDENKNEAEFNAGITWVEVTREGVETTY